LAALGTLLALTSCATDIEGDVRSFTDGLGRACIVDLHDIRSEAECDVEASEETTCSEGVPCFSVRAAVRFTDRSDAAENCAGCCVEADRTTYVDSATCAPLRCETNADCLFLNEVCVDGGCYRPAE
jgi:hypothetical protein